MKVDNSNVNRLSRNETEGASPLERNNNLSETASNVEGFSGKDKATLSDRARLLAKARVAMDETPETRSEKVDQLRVDIQTGNYKVPYAEVVNRVLSQVRMV